ncbi:NAD(P)-binding protein [Zopfia rhizophila CBS 207.26]|uniref:NAD(P)-binding protein n=1 Tax=Zopfia rhizophila CBS 207.26 TaxID=1314779 RepID=A0A6A6E502_9PEZI|nr:NAD(P)-binding protein [Zopfia rhizophila CBS 207.26]
MPSYLIIGASRGIGYQYLKHLSSEPSNKVVGIARNRAAVQSRVDTDKLPNVRTIQGDLTDAASLNAAAQEAAEYTGGAIDYLIINGAYLSEQTLFLKPTDYIGQEEFFLDELTSSMNTNAAGVLYAINAFLPYVRKSSIKKVVVISSGHADTELVGIADVTEAVPYAISKAAANILVAKYAAQFKDEGLIFLALSPGVVLTMAPSLDNLPPEVSAAYERMTKQFQKYEPSFKGPMTPEQSVAMQLKVIEGVTINDSGAFLSHLGTKRWL